MKNIMIDFIETLPLTQIRTLALALVYSSSTYLALKILLRFLRRLPPIGKFIRLTNLTIWLFAFFVFLWGIGLPSTNFVNNFFLAISLILAGFLAIITLEYFIFDMFFKGDKKFAPTPGLLRDVLRMIVLLTVVFAVISGVFHFDLSTVLVSSAVLTAVMGLALQDLLGSVVAGVALNIEKPFNVGDFVQVAGQDGEVVSISWRATRLKTIPNNYVIIPNNSVSKAEIVNYSLPEPMQAKSLNVGTSYNDPPNKVKKAIFEVATQIPGILKYPPPVVRTIEYSDFSINYTCRYFIQDYMSQYGIGDDFASRLWYKFKREGIEIPFPIRTIMGIEQTEQKKISQKKEAQSQVRRYLRSLPLFSVLSDESIDLLSKDSQLYSFGVNEDIITQGDEGNSMFVIVSGLVKVIVRNQEGIEAELARLGPGEAFGEMSLFTGEQRTATVKCVDDSDLVEVTKQDFKDILLKDSSLVEKIAGKIELRSQELKNKLREVSALRQRKTRKETSTEGVFRLIKNFFEL